MKKLKTKHNCTATPTPPPREEHAPSPKCGLHSDFLQELGEEGERTWGYWGRGLSQGMQVNVGSDQSRGQDGPWLRRGEKALLSSFSKHIIPA